MHERISDADLLSINDSQGEACESQEGTDFSWKSREVEGGTFMWEKTEGGLVEAQLGV